MARHGHGLHSSGGLVRCDRGAVMVTTIFMVLFLVAMLYMVIGIGKTLVMREGLQDAADAAAYSSAIFSARGMNLIVFINLLMAALVAVLIALRVAQTLLFMLGMILTGLSYTSGGLLGPLAAQSFYSSHQVGQTFRQVKRVVFPVLETLHTTQEAVSVVVPWVAMTTGMSEAARHHAPANGAFAVPGSIVLPVESDDYSKLCEEGAEMALRMATSPFPRPMRSLVGYIEEDIGTVANKTSGFLCGDGNGSPPTHSYRADKEYPRHPDEDDCEEEGDSACRRIERDAQDARPRESDGSCRRDCGYHGPYETMARAARRACEPSPGRDLDDFVYQEREVQARFTHDGERWVEASRSVVRRRRVERSRAPCGWRGTINDREYNSDSGPESLDEPLPVCREMVDDLQSHPASQRSIEVRFVEVVRIFSCVERITRTESLADEGDSLGGQGSERRSPHRVEEELELGDEAFQIRALAFGDIPGPGSARRGVVLADPQHRGQDRWGAAAPGGPGVGGRLVGLGAQIGRLSVAQSEYYFDGPEGGGSPDQWMWEMNWTARLRHFRLPSGDDASQQEERRERTSGDVAQRVAEFGGLDPDASVADRCDQQGGHDCDGAESTLSLFDRIVRH